MVSEKLSLLKEEGFHITAYSGVYDFALFLCGYYPVEVHTDGIPKSCQIPKPALSNVMECYSSYTGMIASVIEVSKAKNKEKFLAL